ncbi:TetR/AcrR family transcriptional regulator [Alteromonas sediminis]|uniref:TetR/AcrR family transcriptional regulator n=1 Tax=Alteromonas sediminis TaxID=2259342 RepID=A0A3N5XX85_9ALTE|nr:TetR/AcrR family transcriptional regulator [Alteromonas sediminis]RPJ65402.1 TetR/AcrR family transcriptional regulator [Alteromonas sediminis]
MKQAVRAGRPKSREKREAILRASVELFLKHGVKETSMDEVARLSGVSKQTIYSHYKNKDSLFLAVIAFKCEEHMISLDELSDHQGGLESTLSHIGRKFLALFQDEEVIAMYSIIIAEARNSPRVAELFYEAGPLASLHSVAGIIHKLSDKSLSMESARLLAMDFYSFLKGSWHMRSLMNLDFRLNETARQKHVDAVVAKTMCLLHHHY